MKQFRKYPIYINYNLFTKEEREAAEFARAVRFYGSAESLKYMREQQEGDRKYGKAYDWKVDVRKHEVNTVDRRLDEIKLEPSSPESIRYEVDVTRALETIYSVPIGKLLLDLMTLREKIWIVIGEGDGPGVASTTPGAMRREQGGGVRLQFDPSNFAHRRGSYTADDVLFHELVHAYRFAKLDITKLDWHRLRGYHDPEEFIAIQMQNVYLSMRGQTQFYYTHDDPRLESKEVVYANIAADPLAVRAFVKFLITEPMAAIVAAWPMPDFNPWRDRQRFESLLTDDAPSNGRDLVQGHLP